MRGVIIAALVAGSMLLVACGGEGEQEKVATPAAPIEAAPATKTYSKYGFSFEYPKDFPVSESGLMENEASDNSGMVQVGVENGEVEFFQVGWINTLLFDLESGLEGGFVALEGEEDVASLDRGEVVEGDKAGHRMLYQYFTATATDGDEARGIGSVLYCDKSQKAFTLLTINNTIGADQDVLKDFETCLDSFACH